MEATTGAFLLWEADDAGEQRFGDEFTLTAQQVADLEPEWRLAYVARLIRSIARPGALQPSSAAASWGARTMTGTRPDARMRELIAITEPARTELGYRVSDGVTAMLD